MGIYHKSNETTKSDTTLNRRRFGTSSPRRFTIKRVVGSGGEVEKLPRTETPNGHETVTNCVFRDAAESGARAISIPRRSPYGPMNGCIVYSGMHYQTSLFV
ncbi:hypothetical protein EVAR_18905_1 [Eumeta japonica]|uniref:Uncharacterized protein n=1 Tax=Eumeta variegata TaxID=151549 RepID=A0A4C1V3C7_EUMVA|nr:hypothetical protein EVAR_18905_1 [Eumeta japonica]